MTDFERERRRRLREQARERKSAERDKQAEDVKRVNARAAAEKRTQESRETARSQGKQAAQQAAKETAQAYGKTPRTVTGTAAGRALAETVDRRMEERRALAEKERGGTPPPAIQPLKKAAEESAPVRGSQELQSAREKAMQEPYTLTVKGHLVEVRAMYNEKFKAGAQKLGGRFSAGDETWRFPIAQKASVEALCQNAYLGVKTAGDKALSEVAKAGGPKVAAAVEIAKGVASAAKTTASLATKTVGFGYDGVSGAHKAGRVISPGKTPVMRALLKKDDEDEPGRELGLERERALE